MMATKLKSASNIILIIVTILALLAVGVRWIVWPLVRSPIFYGYMIDLESILWNLAYALFYTLPLLVLLVYSFFRGVSYKSDYVLPFVYLLLAVRPVVGVAEFLVFNAKFSITKITFSNILQLLFPLGELLLGVGAVVVAVLCLCRVRSRWAVLPITVMGALFLLMVGANSVRYIIEYIAWGVPYLYGIVNLLSFALLFIADVLLHTALITAGTGRKKPVEELPLEEPLTDDLWESPDAEPAVEPEWVAPSQPESELEPVEPVWIAESESDPEPEPSAAVAAAFSVADEIIKFKALMDQGVITAEEFERKKKQLLNS